MATAVDTSLQGRMTLERMAHTMPVNAPIFPEPPYYYRDMERLIFVYETDPEAVLDLLPEGLELRQPATAVIAFLDIPTCTLGRYFEAFQSVLATFEGEPVQYVVHNLLTSDAAVAVGREIWGVPKKMAHVGVEKHAEGMIGFVERPKGNRIAEGFVRPERLMTREEAKPFGEPLLTLRVIPDPEGRNDPLIELIEHFSPETNKHKVTEEWYERQLRGPGSLRFEAQSEVDPWHKLPVVKMVDSFYSGGPWSFELPYGRILKTYDANSS
jgi:acetoacetate decarboxylase